MANDPIAAFNKTLEEMREYGRERLRRIRKMKAEAFQRRECGLALPRASDGDDLPRA